jgi:hypothetical protein
MHFIFNHEFFFSASDNIMQQENMDKILLEPNLSIDDVEISLIYFCFIVFL